MKTFLISSGVVLAILAILGGGGLWIAGRGKGRVNVATPVRVECPVCGDLVESVNAPGEIQPLKKVEISARVSARIIELPYKAGEHVTVGDPNAHPPIAPSVLLRLDSTEMQAVLRSAESRRSAQEAQIQVEQRHLASQEANITGIRTDWMTRYETLTASANCYDPKSPASRNWTPPSARWMSCGRSSRAAKARSRPRR